MRVMTPEQLERKHQKDAEWRAKNADRKKAYQKRWLQENAERVASRARQWRENNRDRARGYKLKTEYGLTVEDYDRMLQQQGGVCAICKGPHRGRGGFFHVDHDHGSGRVRGLLCGDCNFGIGFLKDSPELLQSAMEYLCSRK